MEIQTYKIQINDVNANNRDHDQNLKKRIKVIRTFTTDLRIIRNGLQLINLLITVEEKGKNKIREKEVRRRKKTYRGGAGFRSRSSSARNLIEWRKEMEREKGNGERE